MPNQGIHAKCFLTAIRYGFGLLKARASERKQLRWNKVSQIMGKIDSLALSSPCNKLKVAYALVDSSFNIIEFATNGYEENGGPCSKTGEDHHCVHAEISLIKKIRERRLEAEDCIFIGNVSPCSNCMNELVDLGIREVVFKDFFHDLTGLVLANNNDVKCTLFSDRDLSEINKDHLEWLFSRNQTKNR